MSRSPSITCLIVHRHGRRISGLTCKQDQSEVVKSAAVLRGGIRDLHDSHANAKVSLTSGFSAAIRPISNFSAPALSRQTLQPHSTFPQLQLDFTTRHQSTTTQHQPRNHARSSWRTSRLASDHFRSSSFLENYGEHEHTAVMHRMLLTSNLAMRSTSIVQRIASHEPPMAKSKTHTTTTTTTPRGNGTRYGSSANVVLQDLCSS